MGASRIERKLMKISTIQLPIETIETLRKLAKREDRSMASYIRILIAEKAKEVGIE